MKTLFTLPALALAFLIQANAHAASTPNDLAHMPDYKTLGSLYPCEFKQALQTKAIGPSWDDMVCTKNGCTLPPQPADKLAKFELLSHKDAMKGDLFVSFPMEQFSCDMQASVLTSSVLPRKTSGRIHYLLRPM